MLIENKVNLQALNTLAAPSTAEYFVSARTVAEVQEALLWASKKKLPVHILGGGSNVVLMEKIPGLLVRPLLSGLEQIEPAEDALSEQGFEKDSFQNDVLVKVGAGEIWHEVVKHCTESGWYGLENLAYIPGLAGAAPIQNIGAYGVELSNVFYSLQALDREKNQIVTFSHEDCGFAYRDSVFKHACENRFVILSISLRLSKIPRVKLTYPGLNNYLKDEGLAPEPLNVMHAVIAIRQSRLPDPTVTPNAGSFFKNPIISIDCLQELKTAFPDIVYFDHDPGRVKLAAAWLIDSLGWKTRDLDGVSVHQNQALVMTNTLHRPGKTILELAKKIQSEVKNKFAVTLEKEPRILGELPRSF